MGQRGVWQPEVRNGPEVGLSLWYDCYEGNVQEVLAIAGVLLHFCNSGTWGVPGALLEMVAQGCR